MIKEIKPNKIKGKEVARKARMYGFCGKYKKEATITDVFFVKKIKLLMADLFKKGYLCDLKTLDCGYDWGKKEWSISIFAIYVGKQKVKTLKPIILTNYETRFSISKN